MAFENAIEADLLHQSLMEDKVPLIMESVFECTLEMINKDFHEYPEHRVQFFKLLQAINLYCFPALLKLDATQFKFVIDSCMWASKHDNREVENTGLTMCLELMNNMAETDTQTSSIFFRQFFIPILQDVFFVLTDSDHKAGSYTSMVLEELTLTFWQGSNLKQCYCPVCSTSSNPGRSKNPSIPPNKRRSGHPTETSCKNTLPTSYKMLSRIFRSKLAASPVSIERVLILSQDTNQAVCSWLVYLQ